VAATKTPTAKPAPRAQGTIALVDDEENIRETVAFALRRDGYRVELFRDGQEAWEAFQHAMPDLVVLDILMPRMDGLELCRRLRGLSERLPILFLTSRDDELDRVLGLELGADDYLCKPFSMRELEARVRVLFRRLTLHGKSDVAESKLTVGNLELDLNRYEAKLTITEFLLLRALARHPGHVKTRSQLMDEAYPDDAFVSERTIDSHIKRLRKKFAEVDAGFDHVETVYGLGYRYR
jgi:two-component system response regulator ChvI